MRIKYQTNVKYEDKERPITNYWYYKDNALDYYNECDSYGRVEWKHIDRMVD